MFYPIFINIRSVPVKACTLIKYLFVSSIHILCIYSYHTFCQARVTVCRSQSYQWESRKRSAPMNKNTSFRLGEYSARSLPHRSTRVATATQATFYEQFCACLKNRKRSLPRYRPRWQMASRAIHQPSLILKPSLRGSGICSRRQHDATPFPRVRSQTLTKSGTIRKGNRG